MFGRKHIKHHLKKPIIYWFLAVALLSIALFEWPQHYLMSSIIDTPSVVDVPMPPRDHAEKNAQTKKIHDATHIIEGELTQLYARKTSLKNTLQLKKHLLSALENQENGGDADATVKKLKTDIAHLSAELEGIESKITTIYATIATYSEEVNTTPPSLR